MTSPVPPVTRTHASGRAATKRVSAPTAVRRLRPRARPPDPASTPPPPSLLSRSPAPRPHPPGNHSAIVSCRCHVDCSFVRILHVPLAAWGYNPQKGASASPPPLAYTRRSSSTPHGRVSTSPRPSCAVPTLLLDFRTCIPQSCLTATALYLRPLTPCLPHSRPAPPPHPLCAVPGPHALCAVQTRAVPLVCDCLTAPLALPDTPNHSATFRSLAIYSAGPTPHCSLLS